MIKSKKDSRQKVRFAIRKKVSGTSERPRLAVFRSNKEIYAQIINDVTGTTLASASSYEAKGNKTQQAAVAGKLIADNAKKAGVKPILGCEVYVSAGKHNEKTYNQGNNKWGYYHLVLLAQNNTGYKNLMKLTTIGYLEGFYYRPRIDKELLKKYNEGLIATSACLAGEVTSFAAKGDYDSAKKAALEHLEIFDGRFYLELQNHGIKEEDQARAILIKLSEEVVMNPFSLKSFAIFLNSSGICSSFCFKLIILVPIQSSFFPFVYKPDG